MNSRLMSVVIFPLFESTNQFPLGVSSRDGVISSANIATEMTSHSQSKKCRHQNGRVSSVDYVHGVSCGLTYLAASQQSGRTSLKSLKSAMDADLNVVLSTNGLLLSRKASLLPPLSVRLHISMDSGFAAVHES